jgi:SAM-dependent methyltransferase
MPQRFLPSLDQTNRYHNSMSHDLDLWNSSAEAWITSQGEKGDSSRQFLDPFVLDLLGDVTGKSIADIGCGEGRFARLLTTKAARVTGVEPAENLFNAAETKSTGETYLCEGATELSIADQSQDVVIFYLSMIDFDPFEPAISEANRILKPGGRCMVINTSSKRLLGWSRSTPSPTTLPPNGPTSRSSTTTARSPTISKPFSKPISPSSIFLSPYLLTNKSKPNPAWRAISSCRSSTSTTGRNSWTADQ